MSPRVAAIVAAIIIALPLAWLAGEQHRENCIRLDRTGCSVLPWDAGESPRETALPLTPAQQRRAEFLQRRAERIRAEHERRAKP
ncbi:MAG TPA: hypothetical protein VMY78_16620 [Solirubrobacteraceae bacterium]|nr:hypothetical protein [Solirubrobacteraceae bacterium]